MFCGGGISSVSASKIDYSDVTTLIDCFEKWCEQNPDAQYLCQPMGGSASNLKFHTFSEARTEALKMASHIASLNLEPGSKIGLMSKNCSWWFLADMAIAMAGHVTIPIYPTLTADTVEYIIDHSEAKLCFVGKLDVAPWAEMKSGVPASMPVISFPLCPADLPESYLKWDSIIAKETPLNPMVKRTPEELATIIYTSGSTGKPKGVMHNFKTMLDTTAGFIRHTPLNSQDRYISYLPLAHGMERWAGLCFSQYVGNQVYFVDSLDTFVQDLNRARPTLFVSVPRLWTKFQMGVFKKLPPAKLDRLLKIPIVSSIIKKKILKGLGLDCVRLAGSGSAPVPKELIDWYNSLGLKLLEGYGMTENFNYSHMNTVETAMAGTVGKAYDDVTCRIAEDGEIQVKTPGLMMGYYKNQEATDECITSDGYLRTGDQGECDSMGRLKITGRTKEIFKTSKGKYVAPSPIETKFINHAMVELACVGGSSYPAAHALVQLSEDWKEKAEAGGEDVRKEITAAMEKHLKTVNESVDGHEASQFVVIIKDVWLPDNGLLTPTQKIVRKKIEAKYADNNDSWYGSRTAVIWHGW